MATPIWLAAFPQTPDVRAWRWEPQENKVVFRPSLGPSISRRRGTVKVFNFGGTFSLFTGDEMAVFETWFTDELADGALHYLWDDPISGISAKWKIKSYQFESVTADLFQLRIEVDRLPGAAV